MAVVIGSVLVIADKLTHGTWVGGVAGASSAGNASAVRAVVSAANPAAAAATVLVASSVVVTAIPVPLATAWWAGRSGYITLDQPYTVPKRPSVYKAA